MESKEPDLRRQAGDPVNPKALSDLIHQTPEQQLIEAIRSQGELAKGEFEKAWRDLLPRLDRWRSSKTSDLFQALSELDKLPLTATIDRRFALVDGILATARKTPRKGIAHRRIEEENIKKVKLLIKSMAAEGKTYEVICKRLDATGQPRPSTTRWGHLNYREALASPDHCGAVKTWLSKASHK